MNIFKAETTLKILSEGYSPSKSDIDHCAAKANTAFIGCKSRLK
jgi:hypothetical protein